MHTFSRGDASSCAYAAECRCRYPLNIWEGLFFSRKELRAFLSFRVFSVITFPPSGSNSTSTARSEGRGSEKRRTRAQNKRKMRNNGFFLPSRTLAKRSAS